jgi:hypothetical protein
MPATTNESKFAEVVNGFSYPADHKGIPQEKCERMKFKHLRRLRDPEGKGLFGCMLMIVLIGVAIYLAILLAPIYYANFNFESEIKTEIARAGAHFLSDDTVTKDILVLAKRNEINIKAENISTERFAGQLHVRVEYSVPVDFIIFERDLVFKVNASSFIGSL